MIARADFEYDIDTAVEPLGEGRYRGVVSPRWSIGNFPNGGYTLGIALAAIAAELPHPDPVAVSAHYLRPTLHGPAEIAVEVVRSGRAHSTAQARISQEGAERVRALATFGDLGAASGPTVVLAAPPDLPPPDRCVSDRIGALPNGLVAAVRDRLDTVFDPATVGWASGQRSGRGEVRGWMRFADGRPLDPMVLPFLCDAAPPAVFDLVDRPGWVPTIELSVHVRAVPAPGWLAFAFRTRVLIDGYLEEDGELWDSDGRPVAMSRQLARVNQQRESAPAAG